MKYARDKKRDPQEAEQVLGKSDAPNSKDIGEEIMIKESISAAGEPLESLDINCLFMKIFKIRSCFVNRDFRKHKETLKNDTD